MSKIVLLDSIRSMQNVGSIFRNADGAGWDKIILTGFSSYPPRNYISKTALGAQDWIDWEFFFDAEKQVKELKEKGYKIYCVELTKDAIDYREFFKEKPKDKICLILGNEITGISKNLLDLSDKKIIIPMNGKKESLNVGVAAGIVMYAVI